MTHFIERDWAAGVEPEDDALAIREVLFFMIKRSVSVDKGDEKVMKLVQNFSHEEFEVVFFYGVMADGR